MILEGNFGRLKKLEVLDLSHDNLNGGIPQDLALVDISILTKNQLQGSIPTQNGFTTSYDNLDFDNNPSLCGTSLPPCNTINNSSSTATTSTVVRVNKKKMSSFVRFNISL